MGQQSIHSGLHFIALIPEEPLLSKIHRYKEVASRRFDSSHAFNAPGHITLFPPFHIKDHTEEVDARLKKLSQKITPFEIQLNGFDHFGKRVIFIDVEENGHLQKLHDRLKEVLTGDELLPYRGHEDFHAHVTIATKDLKAHVFPDAWEYFSEQEFRQSFRVHSLYLMMHQEKEWRVWERYELEGKGG